MLIILLPGHLDRHKIDPQTNNEVLGTEPVGRNQLTITITIMDGTIIHQTLKLVLPQLHLPLKMAGNKMKIQNAIIQMQDGELLIQHDFNQIQVGETIFKI